jgi:DNA-binding IclR family transcriptional regulator
MRPAIDRVRDEFAEMRGFSPTLAQAARLFDLSFEECDRLLRSLVQEGSLTKGVDGRYRLA